MTDNITRAELAQLRARIAQLETKQRSRPRLRQLRRFLPLAVAGLLVALMPLSILAAPVFSDLTTAAPVHQPNIQAIGDAGITTGFEDPADPTKRLYNPKELVTREEMASFLARTAGLGANPPVANAANASTVGGYAPGDLVRVARQTTTPTVDLANGTNTSLGSVTITAPSAGFVLVTATIGTNADIPGTCPCELAGSLTDGTTFSPVFSNIVQDTATANDEASVTVTYVFPVEAGARSFTARGQRQTGSATLSTRATLTALFVPFGSTGGSTLGLGDNPATNDSDNDQP